MSDAAAGKIVQLMKVPRQEADVQWLQDALNSAIKLELSTLPPYLCGYWSITDQTSTAASLILSIVFEEMIHMGLACNLLTTIGGTPEINVDVPTYPTTGLPGGVRPDLYVYLGGLTPDLVSNVCMGIELPESPVAAAEAKTYPTIGAFYTRILEVFEVVQPDITGANQLTTGFSNLNPPQTLLEVNSMDDVQTAIATIMEQGEGTSKSPDDQEGELAHYYKFGEIYYGRTLVQQADGSWDYTGDPIPFPAAAPMGIVPAGGWPDPPGNVAALLAEFNGAFTDALDKLQAAWMSDNPNTLQDAVNVMFNLQQPAQDLMTISGAPGGGNFGPEFLYGA
jgi:hypothetical protein